MKFYLCFFSYTVKFFHHSSLYGNTNTDSIHVEVCEMHFKQITVIELTLAEKIVRNIHIRL